MSLGRQRRGVTLVEILIAAVILAICAVAVLSIYSTSTQGIQRTDERRELRSYMGEIFAHVNRCSLHQLFDLFGEAPAAERKTLGRIALTDENGGMVNPQDDNANPLGFTEDFTKDLARAGLAAKVDFRFYSPEELKLDEKGNPSTDVGLMFMQAGWVTVTLIDAENDKPLSTWKQPIMCPAIVGRPGLKLSSCPAIAPRVKCQYWPKLKALYNLPDMSEADKKQCEEYEAEDAANPG